jgi:hypothetical protein
MGSPPYAVLFDLVDKLHPLALLRMVLSEDGPELRAAARRPEGAAAMAKLDLRLRECARSQGYAPDGPLLTAWVRFYHPTLSALDSE